MTALCSGKICTIFPYSQKNTNKRSRQKPFHQGTCRLLFYMQTPLSDTKKHETGFEPATLALARRYSTTEPLVHILFSESEQYLLYFQKVLLSTLFLFFCVFLCFGILPMVVPFNITRNQLEFLVLLKPLNKILLQIQSFWSLVAVSESNIDIKK